MSTLVSDSTLIAFFSARSEALAIAAAQVQFNTLGVASASSESLVVNDTGQRKIILELTGGSPIDSSGSAASQGGSLTVVGGIVRALITLDVVKNAQGYAQTIEIAHASRQSVHQTAAGFYVDEYNEATGTLSVDALVLFNQAQPGPQVQRFIDMLHSAKLTSPLANEVPTRLRYHDAYLGRTYAITQDGVRLRLDAERPGQAHLTITATILKDYSTSPNNVAAQSILPNAEQLVSSNFGDLGAMSTASGAVVGTTFA